METKEKKQYPLDRLDWLMAGGVWLAAMGLYGRTLVDTVLLGDSGEFQTLAYTLGLAHSTGYSIYILLAKLVTILIPVKDIAYRVDLFSAICAAIALALVYLAARLLGVGRVAAFLGAFALGLVKLFWFHAVIAEVMDQAAMGMGIVLVLVLSWRRTGNTWLLFAAGLAGGLSLGVHNTISLTAPAVLVFLVAGRCSRQGWDRAVLGGGIGIILTIASFFLLDDINDPTSFLNTSARPNLSAWNLTEEQWRSPVERFKYLVFARQWREAMFSASADEVQQAIDDYFKALNEQFPSPVLVLVIVGLLRMFIPWGRGRPWQWQEGLLLALSWLATYFYIINYKIGDINTYYIPSYVPLVIAASVGAGGVFSLTTGLARRLLPAVSARPWQITGGLAGFILILIVFLPFKDMVVKSWNSRQISFLRAEEASYPYPILNPQGPRQTALRVAAKIEDNAIVFTDWGILWPIAYVTHVEQGRTSIQPVELTPYGSNGRFPETALAYIAENIATRPIYINRPEASLRSLYDLRLVDGITPLYKLEKR